MIQLPIISIDINFNINPSIIIAVYFTQIEPIEN